MMPEQCRSRNDQRKARHNRDRNCDQTYGYQYDPEHIAEIQRHDVYSLKPNALPSSGAQYAKRCGALL